VPFELAQFNIARLTVALDDPEFAAFIEAVAPVQAQAEAAPGYLWRDQYIGQLLKPGPFADDELATITVWTSIDALRAFTYSDRHREVFQARRTWFAQMDPPTMALWWVPAGHRPEPEEAQGRLARLAATGPGPEAFSFGRSFPPPCMPPSADAHPATTRS
jgi:heme-degrading monooxygenase HmoA